MTMYPVFATGTDTYTGVLETLTGTIDVTYDGEIINPHLFVTNYSQEFNGFGDQHQYGMFSYYRENFGNSPLWAFSVNGVGGGLVLGLGTRGPVPTFGADIFWFTVCCRPDSPVVNVSAPYFSNVSPLGTIPHLPLPLAIPVADIGSGWTSLLIVALMWGCYRHRRAMR